METNTNTTTAATPETQKAGTEQQAENTTPALFDELEEPERDAPGPDGETNDGEGKGEETEAKPLTREDIAVPDGFSYDEELGNSFLDIVNDDKLSRKELAGRLVGMYAKQQGKMLAALAEADKAKTEQFEAEMKREKEEWMKQCRADGEFGGQNWEAAQAVIDRGCKQVATQGAIDLMQRYGLNTHPEIVRMFYRAGKLAGEDRGGGGASGSGKMDPAEAIFGESLRTLKNN